MLKKRIRNIVKVKYYKNIVCRNELKIKILKSIIQNKSVAPLLRFYANWVRLNQNKNYRPNKYKRVCMIIGQRRGFLNNWGLCRHSIKRLSKNASINNVKIRT